MVILLKVYPEQLLVRVAKKTFATLGCDDNSFYEEMGYFFVEFVAQFGYGDVLALLGRQLRDFLNGLDNLHEYLKFSYPRFVTNKMTALGAFLQYLKQFYVKSIAPD